MNIPASYETYLIKYISMDWKVEWLRVIWYNKYNRTQLDSDIYLFNMKYWNTYYCDWWMNADAYSSIRQKSCWQNWIKYTIKIPDYLYNAFNEHPYDNME